MGYIYRDKRTGWYVGEYFDAHGRRRREKLSRIRREAEATLALVESKVIRERLTGVRETQAVNFGEFADRYLGSVQEALRPKTLKRYRTSLNKLKPFFGNSDLTAITPERIDQCKAARMEGIADPARKQKHWATMNRDLQLLRAMFNLAIEWDCPRENPVRPRLFFKESKGRIRYLTPEEYNRLLGACRTDIRRLVVVAVHTGMRLDAQRSALEGAQRRSAIQEGGEAIGHLGPHVPRPQAHLCFVARHGRRRAEDCQGDPPTQGHPDDHAVRAPGPRLCQERREPTQ